MKALNKFYAKLKPGERRILAVTVFIVGFLFVDRVIVIPITSTLTTLNQNVHDQETSIRKSMNMLLHKETITAESTKYASYSIEAKNSEEEMVGLLREVESVAGKAGVSLLYVRPGTIKDELGTKKFYATMECEGTMVRFDKAVEAYQKATELNPKFPDAFQGLGSAYYWSENLTAALQQVDALNKLGFADKAAELERWIKDKEAKKKKSIKKNSLAPEPVPAPAK